MTKNRVASALFWLEWAAALASPLAIADAPKAPASQDGALHVTYYFLPG